jgi:hypothetical protein
MGGTSSAEGCSIVTREASRSCAEGVGYFGQAGSGSKVRRLNPTHFSVAEPRTRALQGLHAVTGFSKVEVPPALQGLM